MTRYISTEYVLRITLAIMLMYFAYAQLSSPLQWSGYIPEWLPGDAGIWVLINGTGELVCALLLLAGLWVRWVAALMSVHVLCIAWAIGLNPTGVRDFAIAGAFAALALVDAKS